MDDFCNCDGELVYLDTLLWIDYFQCPECGTFISKKVEKDKWDITLVHENGDGELIYEDA
ncbi:MAG: hypothetical protein ACXABD_22715 [Candidatus Thorarchaeota archaeon]